MPRPSSSPKNRRVSNVETAARVAEAACDVLKFATKAVHDAIIHDIKQDEFGGTSEVDDASEKEVLTTIRTELKKKRKQRVPDSSATRRLKSQAAGRRTRSRNGWFAPNPVPAEESDEEYDAITDTTIDEPLATMAPVKEPLATMAPVKEPLATMAPVKEPLATMAPKRPEYVSLTIDDEDFEDDIKEEDCRPPTPPSPSKVPLPLPFNRN